MIDSPAHSADSADSAGAPTSGRWQKAWRVVAALVVLAAILYAARQAGGYMPQFAQWVDELGIWGPLVYILGYAVATVAFIPGSLLTLAGGAIFGLAKGTLYVFIGATLGATAAFLVARYLARATIERRLSEHPRFAAIDRAAAKQGFKIVFLLRLSPVFPFVLLNYGLGLTKVRLLDFVAASIGMLPGTLLYVYYGKAAGDLAAALGDGGASGQDWGKWAVMAVGLLATIAVTTVITRLARAALRQASEDPAADSDIGEKERGND